MLWVNLIMDTFAALALATEPPSKKLLERAPVTRNSAIVNGVMWRNIVGQGFFQILVLMVLLFAAQNLFGIPYERGTPFYADLDYITQNPQLSAPLGAPTNKALHFTLVF